MKTQKIILFIAVSIFVSFSFAVTIYANGSSNQSNELEVQQTFCDFDETSISICFQTDGYQYFCDEIIDVSYCIEDNVSIISFDYIQSGFSVIDICIDENDVNKINMQIFCLPEFTEASITINATLSNLQEVDFSLYAIKNDYGVFISPSSIEHANQRYENYAINSGIHQAKPTCTLEEWIEINFDDLQISSSQLENFSSTYSTYTIMDHTIEGTLLWTDDSNIDHKLRGVKVELYAEKGLVDVLLVEIPILLGIKATFILVDIAELLNVGIICLLTLL